MVKELYIVGDETRLVVKNFLHLLEPTDCTLKLVGQDAGSLGKLPKEPIHLILCLAEGINFSAIRKLAELQKLYGTHLYFVGSPVNMSASELDYFYKIPSVRFPSYSLDINKLLDVMEKNDVERKRILVVDDEPILLRNIKGWLENDFEVYLVPSGEMALEFLDMHPVDLILLDYLMPNMDGPEVLRRIREDKNKQQFPVIFLTANNDKNSIMKAMHMKPDGYILKSTSPEDIRKAVLDFFKNRVIVLDTKEK